MGAHIRRLQSNLIYGGMGVIIFMVWTLAKFVMMEYTKPFEMPDVDGLSDTAVKILVFGIVAIIIAIDFILRIYIGKCAISEGMGDFKKSSAYIVISSIFLVVNIISYFIYAFSGDKELITDIPSLIVDLTSSLMLFQIIVSGIWLRVYRKNESR